ncbi:MAG: ADP-glyceromanno-heptose 6-epimerase [Bacteroidia bacterium]|nr:ADP-glyceromanno-heptose 6-epimerase [Bacteroidia bacterium]
MNSSKKIILTGAAGFIGSCLAADLNAAGEDQLILVDDFSRKEKELNYAGKKFLELVTRDEFFQWVNGRKNEVGWVLHLGARTDTAEMDTALLNRLNLNYSKQIWSLCAEAGIPLIYASSAATYGGGELGFEDSHELPFSLKPLNPYGVSKNEFDKWALQQEKAPPFWAGLKFFNVYGPNEYHKGRMASVIFHAFRQIQQTGKMRLFRSHHPDFADGEQLRDFVYVKDVAKVVRFLRENRPASGLYNLGTGKARTFLDLVRAVFHSLNLPPVIDFVDTPADIRDNYQYFTEAKIQKLLNAGYSGGFSSLEEGVKDYVENYLVHNRIN